ncbi:toxin-antitoxin system YwqK family antitoxin [Aquimarina algicola]|uniref:Toxin-antitoxin system YwqK family antitoxin n=1 Tax=Aquimarina algicola TaxID=2589995 RepID=A0A504J127_9FLAO|nr:toxin-antitoxin system YwqK family antitoxin [Aquimarina algicola]TPN81688.1 toxin-antitoxin system YwqK family antitoxin [Aquimarina algicola]
MYNKINLVFLGVLVLSSLAQCKTNNSTNTSEDSKNLVTETKNIEYFKDYYPSGNLKTEGQLIDKEKTGKWISYYENGEQQAIENYKEGLLDGYQKSDYSQVLYMEGYCKNGLKIGTWKSYFKESKILKYLKHYDDEGKATGEWKSYYDSGEIASIENNLNNKANGKQIEYYKNGNIMKVGEKLDGKKNGIWKYYFDDGTLRCEREFKNDIDDGKYVEYFRNGKMYKTGTKQNSKKIGTWKTYDKQGNIVETISYDN